MRALGIQATAGCSNQVVCIFGKRQLVLTPRVRLPVLSNRRDRKAKHQCRQLSTAALVAVDSCNIADLPNEALSELGEGLEGPVQAIYLLSLLGFLVVGAYLVVRQVLIRRELEDAAKVLGDRIRSGSASSEDSFELGVILLRKKLYTQAVKNLESARKSWKGESDELAQVHNALGFAYFNMEKVNLAVENYRKAVEIQPGYVTAWNNLGDAWEKAKNWKEAYEAYSEALAYAPDNKVARERTDALRSRAGAA